MSPPRPVLLGAFLVATSLATSASGGPLSAQEPAFRPLVADPRETGSSIAYLSWTQPELAARVVAVGIGDAFGLLSREDERGRRWDAEIGSVVLAQFNGSKRSFDFVNADFLVGLPVSVSSGDWSARVRLYHWSSHLGDEFLLSTDIERFEVSLGAVDGFVARRHPWGRVYVGGESWFARVPSRLPRWIAHAGTEFRTPKGRGPLGTLGGQGLAAIHVRAGDFGPEDLGVSIRTGLEFGSTRPWAIVFDFYDGPSPHGQFFDRPLRYSGIAFRLTL